MEKRITYWVVFGLLSSSIAMLGMDSPLSKSREIAKDSPEHHLNLAAIKKELIEDVKEADEFVHNAIHKGVDLLKKEEPVIIAALKTVGVQQPEKVTDILEKVADEMEQVDDQIHSLVQKLEEANIAKNDQNIEDVLKR